MPATAAPGVAQGLHDAVCLEHKRTPRPTPIATLEHRYFCMLPERPAGASRTSTPQVIHPRGCCGSCCIPNTSRDQCPEALIPDAPRPAAIAAGLHHSGRLQGLHEPFCVAPAVWCCARACWAYALHLHAFPFSPAVHGASRKGAAHAPEGHHGDCARLSCTCCLHHGEDDVREGQAQHVQAVQRQTVNRNLRIRVVCNLRGGAPCTRR